ncbi:pteridine reductase [Saccharospirillum impatiens]|uniref:pteridine reductase n=1 Tax=Saccharospirillum impatiens TaxID=169438 RepID=UPI00040BA8DB|nr:pteridine reductase [Saccharospirillum impatiens]
MVRLTSTISGINSNAPVVFITGGARRVGAETARVFHTAGFRVVIHYRSSERDANELVSQLNHTRPNSAACVQSPLDTRDHVQSAALAAIEAFGQVDVLINNASSFFPTPWGEITDEAINTLMHSNLLLPMVMIQALAPELKRREGAIINLVDIHALRPLANHPAYGAAKAGLISLTKSAALDLAPQVRANAIAPGAILLPEHEGDEYEQELTRSIPLARMGSPTDIAEAALFLATAPYISGQILPVDGGRTLKQ